MKDIKYRMWVTPDHPETFTPFMYYWPDEPPEGFEALKDLAWQVKCGVPIMQFTGLKDMDGQDVYESDMIDYGGLKPLVIKWRESGFVAPLHPFMTSNPIELTRDGFSHFAKVIGNLHESPPPPRTQGIDKGQ